MCTRCCCWCCRRSRWSMMRRRRRLPRRSCWRRRRRSAFAWATVWRPKRSVYATSPPGSGRRALANRVAWGRSRAGGRSDVNRRTEAAVPDGGGKDFRNEGGLRGRRTAVRVRSEIHSKNKRCTHQTGRNPGRCIAEKRIVFKRIQRQSQTERHQKDGNLICTFAERRFFFFYYNSFITFFPDYSD